MTAVAIDADSACRNILGEWRGRIPGNVLVMEAHPAIGDFYLQEFDLSRPSYCRVMENVPFSAQAPLKHRIVSCASPKLRPGLKSTVCTLFSVAREFRNLHAKVVTQRRPPLVI